MSVMDQSVQGGSSGDPAPLRDVVSLTTTNVPVMVEHRNDEVDNETFAIRGSLSYINGYQDVLGNVNIHDRVSNGQITTATRN
jgi:hypothetical protein